MLKNHLHASAMEVSAFRSLTGVPLYLSFLFGLARDYWNPLGRRDRGFFLLFGAMTAATFVWLAITQLTYAALFVGMLFLMVTFRFVTAAHHGLIALVGQEKLMSGRLSVLWHFVLFIPSIGGAMASGWLTEHVRPRETFLFLAVLAFAISTLSLWKPGAVFSHAYGQAVGRRADHWGDLRRLVQHRAVYPAVLLVFLFQFAPGAATPLQFYMSDHLHLSDAIFADYTALFLASFIPTLILYGWLCKRVSFGKLLWWGTIITIPQMIPRLSRRFQSA
jgi:hypothetical protein